MQTTNKVEFLGVPGLLPGLPCTSVTLCTAAWNALWRYLTLTREISLALDLNPISRCLPAVLSADKSVLCRGSIIAIDSAVPRRGEPPSSSEDADDRTPTAVSVAAAAAAAHAALLNPAYNPLSVISPTASGKPLRYSGSPRSGVSVGTVLMRRSETGSKPASNVSGPMGVGRH